MNVGDANAKQEQLTRRKVKMNGIMQEQKMLQSGRNRQSLEPTPIWSPYTRQANQQPARQIFVGTDLIDTEFAAELEHAHWGLNE